MSKLCADTTEYPSIEFTGRQTYSDFNQNLIQYFSTKYVLYYENSYEFLTLCTNTQHWAVKIERVCCVQLILEFNWVESGYSDR